MKSPFTQKVIKLIQTIPRGMVSTYGQIALLAGNRSGARQVVRILNSCWQTEELPWHRVINSKGTISLTGEDYETQRRLLESEKVRFDELGKVDLGIYLWRPLNSSEHDGD